MGRKIKYDKQKLIDAIESSTSIRQVIHKLGLNESGSMYASLKRSISDWEIDIGHFRGQGHLKNGVPSNATPLDEILVKRSSYKSSVLKKRLIKAGLIEDKCVKCNTLPEWLGEPITLELDHINGDRFDNRLENLRVLCPNCHSQTRNFRGRKNKSEW